MWVHEHKPSVSKKYFLYSNSDEQYKTEVGVKVVFRLL